MRKLLVAVVVAATVLFGLTSPAAAATSCGADPLKHCYGAIHGGPSGLTGASVYLEPTCLSAPSGHFTTNEMWLGDDNYFVEVGFLSLGAGVTDGSGSYKITGPGLFAFWADQRPGHAFAVHEFLKNPPLTDTYVYIIRTAANTYSVGFGSHTATSSSNTMSPPYASWGAEADTAGAVKNSAIGNTPRYADANGNWQPLQFANVTHTGSLSETTNLSSWYWAGDSC